MAISVGGGIGLEDGIQASIGVYIENVISLSLSLDLSPGSGSTLLTPALALGPAAHSASVSGGGLGNVLPATLNVVGGAVGKLLGGAAGALIQPASGAGGTLDLAGTTINLPSPFKG